jgi:type I restriction enzyme, S subunit
MASEIALHPLGTVARVRSGFAFRSEDMGDLGSPIVKIKNVVPPTVEISDCERVPRSVIDSIPNAGRFALEEGDTLIAMTGATVGKVGRLPRTSERYYLNQRVGKVYLIEPEIADYRFIYYVLSQDSYVRQMFGFADGSAQANISGSQIENLEVPLPPLPEQKSIANILGSLDDKIELNRRMNETLEAMARAVFRSWFVDFDPVRAKADGRKPAGMDAATAALFPDRFIDSPLGPIPAGWWVATIEDLCESISSGGTPARMNKDYWNEGSIPWFKTGELLDGPLLDSEEKITADGLDSSACKLWPKGTILFALYASPTVGRLGVLTQPGAANQAAAGLVPKESIGLAFLVGMLLEARNDFQRIAVGAAQQNINQGVLKSHKVVTPPQRLAGLFSDKMTSLNQHQVSLAEESRTLAAIRDALLPRLLSGELRVPEADALVEAAT